MKWFENLKIRTKILVAFSIVIIFTLAVGMMGLFGMQRIKTDMTNEATIMLPEVQTLMTIKECQTAIIAAESMLSTPGISVESQKEQLDVIADQRNQIVEGSTAYEGLKVSAEDKKHGPLIKH
jgi:hypothetical protein